MRSSGNALAEKVQNGNLGAETKSYVSASVMYIGAGAVLGMVGGYFLKLGTWRPALLGAGIGFDTYAFRAANRPMLKEPPPITEAEAATAQFNGMRSQKRLRKNRRIFKR